MSIQTSNELRSNDMYRKLSMIFILFICLYSISFAQDELGWTKDFQVLSHHFQATGSNTYFILEPNYYLVLENNDADERERLVITVLDETKVVDGLETRIVEERETVNGEIIEVSRNYFAFDTNTSSIFYFGEEVDIYKNGEIANHHGAWASGENGALFGLMIPGIVLLGSRYYQEIVPGVAMDRAEVISLSDTLNTPLGTFTDCLKIEETTPLEPGVKEYKIYAPGIGLIKDGYLLLVEHGYNEE